MPSVTPIKSNIGITIFNQIQFYWIKKTGQEQKHITNRDNSNICAKTGVQPISLRAQAYHPVIHNQLSRALFHYYYKSSQNIYVQCRFLFPLSCNPFRLTSAVQSKSLTTTRNSNFWRDGTTVLILRK